MFHVSHSPVLVSDAISGSSAPASSDVKDLTDDLSVFPAKVSAVRIEHATVMADRPVAEHILKIADERGCDLVVMGTRVRPGRKHRLYGSVTADVVRSAHCPVIVVTAPAKQLGDSPGQSSRQPAMRVKS
jgi:nucleotide-binding universal stress UspA family protein